jgi:hypothetical protein
MLSCKEIYSALNHPYSGVWRERFAEYYDMVPFHSASELKDEFLKRQKLVYLVVGTRVKIQTGLWPVDMTVLEFLRTLILGTSGLQQNFATSLTMSCFLTLVKFAEACGFRTSNAVNFGEASGMNFNALWFVVDRTGILKFINKHVYSRRHRNIGPEPEPMVAPLLQTIQLALGEWALNSRVGLPRNAEFSQQAVYGTYQLLVCIQSY